MRSTILALAGLCATLAFGADIPGLPSCAGSCVSGFGSCSNLDVKCICSSTTLISGLACCVSTTCNAADQAATIQFANAICAGQGIDNLPQSATCAPGASAGTVTASTAGSSASSSSSATATGSATTATGTSASSTGTATGTSSTGASSTATGAGTAATTGAAVANNAGGLGLGMVLAGVLAML